MDIDDHEEPTRVIEHNVEPRKLMILPPSFNESNDNKEEIELLDGLPYIERFSDMQLATAEKLVKDEMRSLSKKDYLKNDSMPKCPIIV